MHQKQSSLRPDGSREKIRIADVQGRFSSRRHITFTILIALYAATPFLRIDETPVLLLDIVHRHFFIFGMTFNAQDVYLIFFIASGLAFLLFFITAIAGRLWCGWACPQTVFLETIFRRIERWIEGDRTAQLALARAPWTFRKIALTVSKHLLYLLCAFVIAHIFLSYFIPYESLFTYMHSDPREHWTAFLVVLVTTGLWYVNFAWFREQLCLIVCPYGRIQSALTDDDSLVIGYDTTRGEPRGKANDPASGDCIHCMRCVHVCPTGIDIREGLQLECIGCANCIDACDAIMAKLGRPHGLIRYDSYNGFHQRPQRVLRPRVYYYTFLGCLGLLVASLFFSGRTTFEANVLRMRGAPYTLTDNNIRNQFHVHIVNKHATHRQFSIRATADPRLTIIIAQPLIELAPMHDTTVPIFVTTALSSHQKDLSATITVTDHDTTEHISSTIPILGPN